MATTSPRPALQRGAEQPPPSDDGIGPAVHGVRGRARRTRFGSPVGFVDPERDKPPASGHLWLLSWLLVASTGAVVITPPEASFSIWWPATYVGVGVLLAAPRARWPVLIVCLAATVSVGQLIAGRDPLLSAAVGTATAVESLVVSLVLRGRTMRALTSGRDIMRLLAASGAGIAVVVVGLLPFMQFLPQDDYLRLAGQIGLSHLTAALCLGPLFMTYPGPASRLDRRQVVQWILLIAVELWIFGTATGTDATFALLPVLLWGAVRQTPRAASIQAITVTALAVLLFSVERGPFTVGPGQAYSDWATATIALQLFLSAVALTALVVATASAKQRQTAEDAEREAEFTRTVLATTDAITLVVDAAGRVELVNGAAERSTGWPARELVGRPLWADLVPADRSEEVRRAFLRADEPEQVDLGTEQELMTRSGQVRRVRLSTSVLDRGPGKPRSVVVTGIDVTDERAVSDLLARMLQASSSSAAIGLDLSGDVTLFSRGASDLLGFESSQVVGASFVRLIARGTCDGEIEVDLAADPAAELARIHQRLGSGSDRPARDWWWRCADSELVAVSQTFDAVTDVSGRPTGYLLIARDVTEERRSQEILLAALRREREAVERLRALDQAKSEFVTTVSHELRTPVSSILGYAEVFRDEVSHERLRTMVDAIARNGYRLRDLADDLVTLSDLEDQQAPGSGPVDLRALLHEVVSACGVLGATRSQTIDLHDETDPTLGCYVQGEHGHVERALRNLLDNALKFSDDGARVQVHLTTGGGSVTVRVVDEGMGIPADEIDRVFQRFYRARNAHERATQGPGLGLSLTETIARLHGGDVRLRSREGAGTEVEVELPMRRPPRRPGSGAVDG